MQKQTQQLILMLVIGVLIGTTGVMAWRTQHAGESELASNSTPSGDVGAEANFKTTSSTIAEAHGLPSAPEIPKNVRVGIRVTDQAAGNMVLVSGLTLTENHWVAVYDENEGHPGWILGAGRVHAGDTSATVELLRPTQSGSTYYAAILADDGDDTFNRLSDLPPLTPDKVVIVSFLAE